MNSLKQQIIYTRSGSADVGFNKFKKILSLLILLTCSCKSFIEVPAPVNQINSSVVFTDDATATSSVLGLYSQMMNNNAVFINGGMSVYCGLSSDELYNASSTTDPFVSNTLPTSNSNVLSLWLNAYKHVYQINACIDGLTTGTQITAPVRQQLLGEVYFCRALCFFYLVNMFGDVPLTTSTDYRVNEVMPRTATSIVYKQIVDDLIEAKNLLIPAYPSAGYVRPNKWAAAAFLARVYLYQRDYKNAEAEASAVIGSGLYSLVPLNNVFLADSKEAILQLIPVQSSSNTGEGAFFVPASVTTRPTYALTPQLLAAFETIDQRKTLWIGKNTVSTVVYNYPNKYKVRTATAKTEYNMVLRLAELYLIRAEARAQQGALIGSNSAASDLNVIRNRAGLGNTPAVNQPDMLLAIEKERQVELFAEWGHRWFDLKRTDRINAVLGTIKTAWKPEAALYPVPFIEIQKNPFLKQNLGYTL